MRIHSSFGDEWIVYFLASEQCTTVTECETTLTVLDVERLLHVHQVKLLHRQPKERK